VSSLPMLFPLIDLSGRPPLDRFSSDRFRSVQKKANRPARPTPDPLCGRARGLASQRLGRHRGPAHLHHATRINLLAASLVIAGKGRSLIATSYEHGASVANDRCSSAPSIRLSGRGERLGSHAPKRPLFVCLAGVISSSCHVCLLMLDRRHFVRC
jgi:hypothetical protein